MILVVPVVAVVLLVILLVRCICIVPQASQWIIEVLGQYSSTWDAGLHFRIPLISRVAKKVSLKGGVIKIYALVQMKKEDHHGQTRRRQK